MKSKLKIVPVGDRVVVKPDDAEEMVGGLFIPDSAKQTPQQGEVIALGDGKHQNGLLIPFKVHVGDKVLVSKYGGVEIKVDGVTYKVYQQDDVIAILE